MTDEGDGEREETVRYTEDQRRATFQNKSHEPKSQLESSRDTVCQGEARPLDLLKAGFVSENVLSTACWLK